MSRSALIATLAALGIQPPAHVDNDTLFEGADARLRDIAGENTCSLSTSPAIDPWPLGREMSRVLLSLA